MQKINNLFIKRQKLLINVLCLVFLLAGLLTILTTKQFYESDSLLSNQGFWLSLLIILNAFVIYIINAKGHLKTASHLLIAASSGAIMYLAIIKDVNNFQFAVIPILLASTTLSLPETVAWSMINIAVAFGFCSFFLNYNISYIIEGIGRFLILFSILAIVFKIHRDLVERDRTMFLKENKDKLLTLLNSLKDGVIATDANCKIEFANPIAEKYLHIDQKSILGRVFKNTYKSTFTKKLTKDSIIKKLENDKDGIIDGIGEFKYNGQTLIMQERIASMVNDDGQITGFIFTFRDITKEKEQETKLQEKLSESEIFLKAAIGREERIQELKNKISANGNK